MLLAGISSVPLIAFDNSVTAPDNMKFYPDLLGFLIGGGAFYLSSRRGLPKKLEPILADKSTSTFLICLMISFYCYPCMNLAVYYVNENSLILKLWSMKSSVFVIVGECLSIILSMRMGEIAAYRVKNRQAREQALPFEMSVSYGFFTRRDSMEAGVLIRAADERMYRRKLEKRRENELKKMIGQSI